MIDEDEPRPQSNNLGEVVESSWADRGQPLNVQERLFEGTLSAAVIVACAALLILAPTAHGPNIAVIAVVIGYALAFRVHYPVGRIGYLVPTQPLLVAMFAVAPVAYVPLFVVTALALSALIGAPRDKNSAERVICIGGDAAHSLGPTIVLLVAGYANATGSPPWIWVLAFLAQLAFDTGFSCLRAWVAYGERPEVELRVFLNIAAIDAALAPLGLLAVAASRTWVWAPLGLLPAVALLDAARRERSARIERAHQRTLELERERERLTLAIQRIGEALAHDLTLDGLMAIVTQASVEVLSADAGRASIAEADGDELTSALALHATPALTGLLDRAERTALATKSMASCDDDGLFAQSCCVGSGEMIVGVVTIARATAFSEFERSLFVYLCGQAEVAAVHVLQHEAVHRQALTDELTGLANQRHLQRKLAQVLADRHDGGATAALILLDIDDFKRFNDTHGHQVGDEVLIAVARCVQRSSRDSDLAARYGGEELALLLPGTTLEGAASIAERLRRDVAQITSVAGEQLTITASLGVAEIDALIHTPSDLVRAADTALYRAKGEGKNRVCLSRGPSEIAPAVPSPAA